MCVLYVSFGSKVRPRTFGCVAMGSALLSIVYHNDHIIFNSLFVPEVKKMVDFSKESQNY